jgi:hypothetical protein
MIQTAYGPVDPAFCHPYLREEIALLGMDDPFESQRAFPDRLRERLRGLPEAALDFRPGPREWSTREVLAHLVQTEITYGYRYRAIVAEPESALAGYDQDLWVSELPESRWPADTLLTHLSALKSLNVAVLEQIPADQRSRWGLHAERGPESLLALIGAIAGHDRMHEAQIEANLSAWGRSA